MSLLSLKTRLQWKSIFIAKTSQRYDCVNWNISNWKTAMIEKKKQNWICDSPHLLCFLCPLADLRGARIVTPLGPDFFVFMECSVKIGLIIDWPPPLCGWRPLIWKILDPPHIIDQCNQHPFHAHENRFGPWYLLMRTSWTSLISMTSGRKSI